MDTPNNAVQESVPYPLSLTLIFYVDHLLCQFLMSHAVAHNKRSGSGISGQVES